MVVEISIDVVLMLVVVSRNSLKGLMRLMKFGLIFEAFAMVAPDVVVALVLIMVVVIERYEQGPGRHLACARLIKQIAPLGIVSRFSDRGSSV